MKEYNPIGKLNMYKHELIEQIAEYQAVQQEYQRWEESQKEFILWRMKNQIKVKASEIKSFIKDHSFNTSNNLAGIVDRTLKEAGI